MPDSTLAIVAQDIGINVLASMVLFAVGYLIGRWRVRRQLRGRNLEQYDFYPFVADADGFPQFSLEQFERGVTHLLKHADANCRRPDDRDRRAERRALPARPGAAQPVRGALCALPRPAGDGRQQRVPRELPAHRQAVRRDFTRHGHRDPAARSRQSVALHHHHCQRRGHRPRRRHGHDAARHRPQAPPAPQPGQAQLRPRDRRTAVQVHHRADPARAVRHRRRDLHEHRHQLHPRPRARVARGDGGILPPATARPTCSSTRTS